MARSAKSRRPSKASPTSAVSNGERLGEIFDRHQPQLVFHAAALKHVPMVELNPIEGARTNIIGTANVVDATRKVGALAMVQVSTDKVVNAQSVMGATKRLAELYCQSSDLDGGASLGPRYITVRFGNVLGSSGSVIPLFERQLARGGPLTITDPDMRRFFMTISEAVALTLQASAHGLESDDGRGDIFVLDMGEPVKIIDIARRMIRLAGYDPETKIGIKVIGRRPGEKLFEELFRDDEQRLNSNVEGVLRARTCAIPLAEMRQELILIKNRIIAADHVGLLNMIHYLLPEFRKNPPIIDHTAERAALPRDVLQVGASKSRANGTMQPDADLDPTRRLH